MPAHSTPLASPRMLRLRLLLLTFAAGALSLLTGCYSEFMGPAPGNLTLVREQPGGSFRTGGVENTVYQVHFFWGVWSPKKTNSWTTLENAVKSRGAAGAYNVQIETYMPWWHIFLYAWTAGIVDVSGHTIKADTYAFSKNAPGADPAALPPPNSLPPGAAPPDNTPTTGSPATTPSDNPAIITGPADQAPTPAPRPGRAPETDPNAPKPVVAP